MTVSFQRYLLLLVLFLPVGTDAAEIDFNRDIRPILSDNCFHCHGPDEAERKGDLRLDTREGALEFSVVPGDADASELIYRVFHDDPDELMPPHDSERSLSAKEKQLLKQWVEEGAPWAEHWSFVNPSKPEVPIVTHEDWVLNEIDHFIAYRLEQENMDPSKEASRETLLRRLSLDLTGLPPTPKEVKSFLDDQSPNAYEKAVDRLLASPRYGEQMALPWLDAARYADTAGYQNDFRRTQWPWRDWVINAFNENMPFDQFTIEQLAGDLLPNATDQQRLATAFNRNHRINNEGGIIPQEFLVEYVADRVETTGTVWMGLTVACARCHDHKYDAISQRDFYQLFAFFNNIPEKGKDGVLAPEPNMAVYQPGAREKLEELKTQLTRLETQKKAHIKKSQTALNDWIQVESTKLSDEPDLPVPAHQFAFDFPVNNRFENLANPKAQAIVRGARNRVAVNKPGHSRNSVYVNTGGYLQLNRSYSDGEGFNSNKPTTISLWVKPGRDIGNVEGPALSCITPDKKAAGFQVMLVDPGNDKPYQLSFRLNRDVRKKQALDVTSIPLIERNQFNHIAVAYDGSGKASGVRLYVNGKPAQSKTVTDTFGDSSLTIKEDLLIGAATESTASSNIRDEELRQSFIDELAIYETALGAREIESLSRFNTMQISLKTEEMLPSQRDYVSKVYFRDHDPDYDALVSDMTKATAEQNRVQNNEVTEVSIMEEMETPRDTYLLLRGVYDAPDTSEKLSPAVPASMPPMPDNYPRNRLGLAQWLVSEENPLTARVIVNRFWQSIFGTGIVKTSEDFGTQGEPPVHPELLDWLAVDFRENGWDVKALIKQMVMSRTYRQESRVTPELLEKDPENRLLARGVRQRLSGHQIRDQALAAAGLLDDRIGGPSVMPYQPEGLWEEVSAKGFKYAVASGDDLYRRSLYTFWRRTVPPPSMMNFDSADREACSVKSTRTNTPLQAMNLLNDPTFVEAARVLGQRMLTEGGSKAESQIKLGYQLSLGKQPDSQILSILLEGFNDYLKTYEADPEAAKALIATGESEVPETLNPSRLAAATAVASVILNLDETVTKE